eukprot:gene12816-14129_t
MSPTPKGHVMLSYQWNSQKEVVRIKERLEADGYDVWMDVDDMQGNIYQRMAEAVQEAAVIVVFMTEKYEQSVNCNKEIQFAQVKQKSIVPVKLEKNYSPSAALGLLVAGSLYIDFTDETRFEANIASLKKEINAAMGDKGPAQEPSAPSLPTPSAGEHLMRVKWVESRSDGWQDGADKIIALLKEKSVLRGQVLAVDAHNNGARTQAMFSAFYDLNHPSNGEQALNLAYEHQNASYSWQEFYETASRQVKGVKSEDIVTLTGCCNEKGHSVFFAFYHYPSHGPADHNVAFIDSRADSWNGAADAIIGNLNRCGAKQGQILSIDAHNNKEDEKAIFSAFWDANLPSQGRLSVGYKAFSAKYGWPTFYDNIATECNKLKRNNLISITGSINCHDSSVMYLFFYKD